MAWEDLVRVINAPPLPEARRWTQARLIRAVKAYVAEGSCPIRFWAGRGGPPPPMTGCR